MTGKFVSFEGIDGAGKSTMVKVLADHLRSRGYDVVTTREPGGTQLAEKIRQLIFDNPMAADTEMLLMFAARTDHMREVILPLVRSGKIVISDRFVDSSFMYQGSKGAIEWNQVSVLEKTFVQGFMPHHTLFLDIPIEESIRRLEARQGDSNRFDDLTLSMKRLAHGALMERVTNDPARFTRIDALPEIDVVADSVRRWANAVFPVKEDDA